MIRPARTADAPAFAAFLNHWTLNTAVTLNFHSRMSHARIAPIPDAGFKFGRYMDLVLMQKFL